VSPAVTKDNFIHLQWRENKKTQREGEREMEMEMEMEKVVAEAEELPKAKAIVCRMVKDALSRCSPDESESLHFHPLSFRHVSPKITPTNLIPFIFSILGLFFWNCAKNSKLRVF
jgi:hypothetical protein